MPDPEELLFPTRKERVGDRRKERHQRKLLDEFFDHPTLLTISRMVTQGQFEQVDYPVSTGKEGGVFRASAPDGYRAVKVRRIGNAIFRRLPPYLIEELLRDASARSAGRVVFAWTRREHTVLRRLRAAGVRVPEPFGYLRNVLVMEFVGTDGLPAPPLTEASLDAPLAVYEELVVEVRRMLQEGGLVHGDLSPYNVLFHEGHPVLIDVAQAIDARHPAAAGLLERDIANFARFFERLGVETSAESMLERVRPTAAPATSSSGE